MARNEFSRELCERQRERIAAVPVRDRTDESGVETPASRKRPEPGRAECDERSWYRAPVQIQGDTLREAYSVHGTN